MTDVVEIARSRRKRLVAEIAGLDDFISTAETLLRLEEDPAGGKGWLTDRVAADAPPAEDRGNVKTAEHRADEAAAAGQADAGSPDPASLDAGSLDPASLDSDDRGGRNLFAPASAEGDELLLGNSGSEDEAGIDAAIGQKLRQRRWMIGMTKRQLAEKLGVGVQEIQNFELGLAHIGTSRMWELASALDVPTSYFFEDAADSSGDAEGAGSGREQAPAPARELALARTA